MAATDTARGRPSTFVPVDIASGVRASARRTPTKVALQEGERTLTYDALSDRIARVASALRATAWSADRSSHSAVMAPNCLEFVEIVLGAASAGVPAAMVNPRSTPAELAYICEDSEARVLFVHHTLEELARSAELPTVEQIVVIGGDYEQWLGSARPAAPPQLEEWDVFCIPYTAGTTGRPKGVLLSHRARALTFFSMAVEYGCYSEDDRTLGVAPLYHGAGFAFSVAALFFGGYCSILPKFDAERVMGLLEDLRITNTFFVPTHFSSVFALGEDAVSKRDLSALHTIICNAAPLSQAMKERIVREFGDGMLYEAYGST
jgi:acyl-CoA synthetase (AMP-forming)/AMP-acid ligase II